MTLLPESQKNSESAVILTIILETDKTSIKGYGHHRFKHKFENITSRYY